MMDLKGIYEDEKYIYKLFEYFKGESVYSLLLNGLVLDEV